MGRCWKLGDNVATDELLPFQYMVLTEPAELGRHLLENTRPDLAPRLTAGDLLLAGANFGYGSSREHAPLALKGAGLGAVVARSYARIFFRNCINLGLPAIVCPEAVNAAEEGDEMSLELEAGELCNHTRNRRHVFRPFSPSVLEYLRNGGLINTLNKTRTTND